MQPMWEIWIAAGATALFALQMEVLGRLRVSHGLAWSRVRGVGLGFLVFLTVYMAGMFGPGVAVALGLAFNVFFGGRSFQAIGRSVRVRRLLEEVNGPGAASALAALEHEVEGLRGGRGGEKSNYDHRARWVLTIAANVARAGHPERALEWTTRIERGVLGRPLATMHAQHEAAFRLATGDRAGARRAIERASRPAIEPWEDALLALEALLDALEGDAEAAVARTTGPLAANPPRLSRAMWQMARAHAQARLGATDEARDTLRALRNDEGDALLRRTVAHEGPASRLAESLLAEQGAYR